MLFATVGSVRVKRKSQVGVKFMVVFENFDTQAFEVTVNDIDKIFLTCHKFRKLQYWGVSMDCVKQSPKLYQETQYHPSAVPEPNLHYLHAVRCTKGEPTTLVLNICTLLEARGQLKSFRLFYTSIILISFCLFYTYINYSQCKQLSVEIMFES